MAKKDCLDMAERAQVQLMHIYFNTCMKELSERARVIFLAELFLANKKKLENQKNLFGEELAQEAADN